MDPLGRVRPMEPAEEIEALRIKPQEIGVIKERPVKRWVDGQEAWDKKFKHTADHVLRKRKHYEAKAQRLLDHADVAFRSQLTQVNDLDSWVHPAAKFALLGDACHASLPYL